MDSLATEIDVQKTQEKMADAISRIEASVQKLIEKDNARQQILAELDSCIASLEQLLKPTESK